MRVFDLIMAIIGMIILSPFFIVIIFLIKISSPGPIIYSQQRVGRNGHRFHLYKFRSMVDNADQIGTSVTIENDPRITKIGRILRKTKLDELPQLCNVLKGDMSFVGPRPDVPEIVNNYSTEMKRILEVRPGITSNATLCLRNEEYILSLAQDPDRAYKEIFIPAKVYLAMEHVNKKSFFFDFSILLQTVFALTFGKLLPLKAHPIVKEIKCKIHNQNQIERSRSRAARYQNIRDVIDRKIPLKMSFWQSLSRNPVPYEQTLDFRSKDCGNDRQRSI